MNQMKTVEQIKIEALWEICFKNKDKELSYLRKIDELEEKIKELTLLLMEQLEK